MSLNPSREAVNAIVRMALLEDAPWGDITSQTLIPPGAQVTAKLVAREPGVLCGDDLVTAAFTLTDPAISTTFHLADGEPFAKKIVLATIKGPARGVLQAERVALNFVQRLSGIATLTAQYVEAAAGTRARITDTRKTTPGLRLFERCAVRAGGGHNHRFSLSDAVLAKDNHLAVLGASGAYSLADAIAIARFKAPHTTRIEIEVDHLDQIESVLAAGADVILLDNFSIPDLHLAVKKIAGRALIEASGGITLDRIGEVASTGVDVISVGALTHSAPSLDIGLDIDPIIDPIIDPA
jgi:nicotinate-nucleotide pyrophosphorylase (carboxylating)